MIAHAVNQGVLNYSALVDVKGFSRPGQPQRVTYNGTNYTATNKIDSRYSGMIPLACFEADTAPSASSKMPSVVCTIKVAGVYGYPFFNHKGVAGQTSSVNGVFGSTPYPKYVPQPCSCSLRDDYCNNLDIITGFVFYGARDGALLSAQTQFQNMMDMLVSAASSSTHVDALVYNASFISLTLGNGKLPSINQSVLSASDRSSLEALTSSSFRTESYRFCGGRCSILNLNFYDPFLAHLSPSFRSLGQMHCADVFTISDASWGNLTATTPTSLVQDYYKCQLSPQKASIDAIGISVGNLSAAMSAVLLVILTLASFAGARRPEPNLPFKKLVANQVLEELANYLLLVRDSHAGIKEHHDLIKHIATAVSPDGPGVSISATIVCDSSGSDNVTVCQPPGVDVRVDSEAAPVDNSRAHAPETARASAFESHADSDVFRM